MATYCMHVIVIIRVPIRQSISNNILSGIQNLTWFQNTFKPDVKMDVWLYTLNLTFKILINVMVYIAMWLDICMHVLEAAHYVAHQGL